MRDTRIAVLLGIAAVALFLPTVAYEFVTDDATYIAENPAVTEGVPFTRYFTDTTTTATEPELRSQSWRPVRTIAFRIVAVVAGIRPSAYHALNFICFGAVTALVYLGLRGFFLSRFGALWSVVFFMLAPVHVEPVLYASSLGDHVSLLFELVSLHLALVSYRRGSGLLAAAASLLLLLSLLAKEMAITAPALLALLVYVERRAATAPLPPLRRAIGVVALQGLACIVFFALRTRVLGGHIGHAALTTTTITQGLMEAPLLVWDYLKIALMPLGHNMAYVLGPVSLASTLLGLTALVGVVLLVAFVSARMAQPAVSVGFAWFVITLLPVLHLVPLAADLADRFAYVPSVGLALCFGAILDFVPRNRRGAPSVLLVALACVALAGSLVERQAWKSDRHLWRHAAEESPASAQAQANLGVILLKEGNFAGALEATERAIALGRQGGQIHYWRGLALAQLERPFEARQAIQRALSLEPIPASSAHANLAQIAVALGERDEAERELAIARARPSNDPTVTIAEARIAELAGHFEESAAIYGCLADRFPSDGKYRYYEALAAKRAGLRERALGAARQCLVLMEGQTQCAALVSEMSFAPR